MNTPALLDLSVGLVLTLLSSPLAAQTVGGTFDQSARFDGFAAGDSLGYAVSAAGDVDADGIGDLILGAPQAAPNGLASGSIQVVSVATGNRILRIDGQTPTDLLGFSVASAGDVDGDGIPDLIAGAVLADPGGLEDAGSAFVYSGATGSLLFRFDGQSAREDLGVSVSGIGDLDGDGVPDLLVGASRADPNGLVDAGSVLVFSGATGNKILVVNGSVFGGMLGSFVAAAGDLDGDGVGDILAGAPRTDPGPQGNYGSAFVFSGATGNQILRFDGQNPGDQLGFSGAGVGDLDADGVPDLILGAPDADPNGLLNAGSAFVFSGATGGRLFRLDGRKAGDLFGRSVSGGDDLDLDGVPDLIVGAMRADPLGRADAGSVFVFSGADGLPLYRFHGEAAGDLLGFSVARTGDVDGDGRADFVTGAVSADPGGRTDAGSALVLSFNPILRASAETLSIAAGGTIDYKLDFPDVDAGASYRILLSAHGTGPTMLRDLLVPLTPDRLFRSSRKGRTPPQASGFQGSLDAHGKAVAGIAAAPGSLPAKLIGRTIFLAAADKSLEFASVARKVAFTP